MLEDPGRTDRVPLRVRWIAVSDRRGAPLRRDDGHVKAAAFEYVRAATLADAFAAMAEHGEDAKLLAGGQSLVPALNLRLLCPAILIDIGQMPELKGMGLINGRLRVGAAVRHVEIERSAIVREHAPLLREAIRHVAHPAVRSRGTLGGNLAHADPASEMPACMVALEAVMVAQSSAGERRIPAASFFLGTYETALRPDEILVAVEIPLAPPGRRHAFLELARRAGDYALIGIACTADFVDGVPTTLRTVFFAAGDHPILAAAAAERLVGREITPDTIAAASDALTQDLQPEGDLQIGAATRAHLARVLLRRAVARLSADAPIAPDATA